ncbi:MAG TPA: SPOR domain-containing protein [Azospirillum sp.]|nr:SPOR domain-containing protein [Azospirillum sp.]
MRVTLKVGFAKVGFAAAAGLGLAGCAGVPVAITAASLYVDTVLFLRTNKTAKDHVISAVAERDCSFMNILENGRLCEDAPPQPLIVAIMREVQNVPPDETRTAEAPPPPIQVAAAPTATLSDTVAGSGAAPLPPRKPEEPAAMPAGPVAQAAVRSGTGSFLVVLGSYTKRSQAAAYQAALARADTTADTTVVEATVFGRRHYRVALRPTGRAEALAELSRARAAGIGDAWLLPWSGNLSVESAVAALPPNEPPYIGWLYRL